MSLIGKRRRILVVDDEPLVGETLALIFRRHELDAAVALSAEEAFKIIATWEPDVAFLDVMLPGMNGIEFGELLRAKYPNCQILLMSGHPMATELLERTGKPDVAKSVLPKPLDPRHFVEIARGAAPRASC